MFYTSLGHFVYIFWNEPLLEHFLAGIQYALGDLKANDTPSAHAALRPVVPRPLADARVKEPDTAPRRSRFGRGSACLR